MKIVISFILLISVMFSQASLASGSCEAAAVDVARDEVRDVTVPIVSTGVEVVRGDLEYIVMFGSHHIAFDYRVLTTRDGRECHAKVVPF